MSITTVENKFSCDLTNFIVTDFAVDSEDVNKIYSGLNKYSISNTAIKINVIKLEEDKHHRVSSFTLFNKELYTESNDWELLEKVEIDNCQVLIVDKNHMSDPTLDEWLEKCISMKELYNVQEDGKICIISGFGPGIYRLMGLKKETELVAIKIEFIKEKID